MALKRDCIYRASFKVDDETTYFGQGQTRLEALENLADFMGIKFTQKEFNPLIITINMDEDEDGDDGHD